MAVLKPARQLANSLQYQPTASKLSGQLYNLLKAVLMASQLSCISLSSNSELQLTRSRAGNCGVSAALLTAPSGERTVPLVYYAFWLEERAPLDTCSLLVVVFVVPISFIALQRIAVRWIADHIILYGQ